MWPLWQEHREFLTERGVPLWRPREQAGEAFAQATGWRDLELRLAELKRGEDPVQDLQENRRAPTVAEFAAQYMELHARPKKKPRSVEKDQAILRLHILPAFASRKLAAISPADVARLHRDLLAHPVQANRVIALLSKMCSLAELWEMRPRGSNPCRGLRRYAERRRERFLSYSEFSRLGEVLAVK